MIRTRITGLVRFLIGILLLQTATVLLTYIALTTGSEQTIWLFVALAALLGLTVAFWFDSVVTAVREQTLARQHERHTREREKLNAQAEREREKLRAQAERDRTKLTTKQKKATGGVGVRAGVTLGGVVGVGIAMMLTQFMTLGLLTVATAGGAALGYNVRTRQERRLRSREAEAAERLVIEPDVVPRVADSSAASKPRRRLKPNKPV